MKPTEQQNAKLRAHLDKHFKPQWAEAIYKEMEGMDVDNRGDHPIWQRDYQDHRWCDNDIFWGIAASPESAIKFIRAYDPDFAAKVLMPPELEWKKNGYETYVCEVFGYELRCHNDSYVYEPNGVFRVRKGETVIQEGSNVADPFAEAEIAFLRHYMKSLI